MNMWTYLSCVVAAWSRAHSESSQYMPSLTTAETIRLAAFPLLESSPQQGKLLEDEGIVEQASAKD